MELLVLTEPDAAVVERDVAAALAEDVGPGDINASLIPTAPAVARIATREHGVLCGCPWVAEACRQVDPDIALCWHARDGAAVGAGDLLVELSGRAPSLLTVERTAINFLQLLSGIATRTRSYVDALRGTGVDVLDTRKTLPGLRVAQKYAVRVGGGRNHRMGLFDAFLLKENHIAAAGGITSAVLAARRLHPGRSVQVEVEDESELIEAIGVGADSILLDNFTVDELRSAVRCAAGRVPLEASGGVTLETVARIGRTGVDFVSVGALTKRIEPLDLSMRFVGAA